MKQLLDYDPIRGVSCFYEYKPATQEIVLTHEQDVQAILDANKADANDSDKTARGIKNDWWKYASIPAIVEIEWMNKFGVDLGNPHHKRKIFELLNHPDYKYLKTTHKVHTINVE
jgi:hypothetical protein